MRRFLSVLIVLTMILYSGQNKNKRKILWVDGSANFASLSDPDKISEVLDKAVDSGIDLIILDIKLITGEVLYSSQYAPQVVEWKGDHRDPKMKYSQIFIEEAHERGLEIHASINVFSEGWKTKNRGVVYSKFPEWETYLNTPEGIVPTTEYDQGFSTFVNPISPEVQKHELNIVKEIINKFDFDGIVLDRARYNNIKSDFSEYSKEQFEKFAKISIENWPEDIFSWKKNNGEWEIDEGPYYKKWLYWRSKNIHDFFTKAQKIVKNYDSDMDFATYVGAWYPSYYNVGVNWAHPDYKVPYDWAVENYNTTGYADVLDYLMTGCYFYHVTIDEIKSINKERKANQEAGIEDEIKSYHTVEGSANLSMKVTQGKLPVYGSLYIQQYKDENDPQQFVEAMKMVIDRTDGIMIFDLIHLEDFGWWNYLKSGLK